MQIMCFGDSNTYGYDPRPDSEGRYPADSRWTDLLAKMSGWTIRNNGMNGRTIPRNAIPIPGKTDLLVIMLGTNDLITGGDSEMTAECMRKFLEKLDFDRGKILLIAPVPLKFGGWVLSQKLIDESALLAEHYRKLAGDTGIYFADAGQWKVELDFDGVHFTREGHGTFAESIFNEIKMIQ